MEDKWNALIDANCKLPPIHKGKLNSYTYAVKDVFEIEGHIASAGNPDWKRTHLPAHSTATVVKKLLLNGAELIGKTHTDELMYSLDGKNYFYGTPVNPRAVERIPGGSSSGSAVAVAAGLVDFSIGTDTGGSVRIPASYCGIYGFRPSHNAISINGVIPLAESFDTVGVMANDIEIISDVAEVLLEQPSHHSENFTTMIFPREVWDMVEIPIQESKEKVDLPHLSREELLISDEGLQAWMETFRILQGFEIWRNHGDWIRDVQPQFGPGIYERFQWAKTITKEQVEEAKQYKEKINKNIKEKLGKDSIMVIPTSPNVAPLLKTADEALLTHRQKLLMMTSIAGLNGLPQISTPWLEVGNAPVGLSFLAAKGQDKRLIRFVKQFFQELSGRKV
ncbi:amidase [Gracilibacillus lacisalsi]|uniref:amidase n=1 Tax=Gracilibacillus lacisalsi TaxID=393087 RepID=UPI000376752D|nr:amidase [Gracilibacillus lacisalsi]